MLSKLKAFTRRSTLSKLLISYLIVLTIPLCGLAVNFTYSNHTIKKEVYAANRTALSSAVLRADDALYQLSYTAQSLFSYDAVMKQISQQTNIWEFYYALPDTISVIDALENSIYSDEVLLYLHDRKYLITGGTSNPAMVLGLSLQLVKGSPYTAEEFTDAMNTVSYKGRYEINDKYSYSRAGRELLTYYFTYRTPYIKLDERDATVFASMPVSRLMELSGFAEKQDSVFMVLDENYRLLTQSDADIVLPENLYRYLNDDGSVSIKLENETYLGNAMDSGVNGWHYMLITPRAQFWSGRNMLYLMCLMAVAAALLTGVAVSILQSRRNYRPIARTLDLMNAEVASGENEFDVIENAWLRMQSEKELIESTLTSRSDVFRRHYLLSYVQGADSLLSDLDMQSFLDINPENKRFALLGLMPVENDNTDSDTDTLKREMCFSRTKSLFAQLFIEDFTGIDIQNGPIQLWLIVMEPEQAALIDDIIDEKLPAVLLEGRSVLGRELSAFLTAPVDTIEGLRAAYAGMMSNMEYRFASDESGIVHLTQADASGVSGPVVILAEALHESRYSDACELVSSMLPEAELMEMKLGAFDILRLLHIALNGEKREEAFERAVARVSAASTKDETRRALNGFLREICGMDEKEEAPGEGADELTSGLEDYIRGHYTDVNLSLATIGAHFSLTPKYLSALYKARTGQSLLDYINKVRVAQAQKLLAETELTVSQVAEMVGYASVKTFRRAFVRVEGENPGKVKPANQQES